MENSYPNVLAPIRVAGHFLKNRIITAPSTIHSASNGELHPTEAAMRFFEDRARSGAALITVAGVSVMPAEDDGIHASWDLYRPNRVNSLAELAERIHFYGAKASMELMGIFPDGWAVSDGARLMNGQPGKEIPTEVMAPFREHYIQAAGILKSLGYDGILLHFGHNIPIAQFLSPYTNKRTDEYGGSTENRVRYLREIIDGIRGEVGKDMIIEVRMSGSEFEAGGIDLDEGIRIGELLQENIDILQVSAGMHNPKWMTVTHPCGFLPPMPNVFLAEAFKASGKIKVPVSTIGGIGLLSDAEEIIASGKADFVAISRALIADPDLIRKGIEHRNMDVTPCIKCMRCHDSTVFGHSFHCAVNPTVGMESRLDRMVKPQTLRKKVAVVGGGPGGMKAALTALERGHDVTLYEKTGALGGALKFADFVSFKYPLMNYKNHLIAQIEKSRVTVKLNTCVAPENLKSEGYDAVVVAVGASPRVPPVPGIENAVPATDVYGNEKALGDSVIIIGGGQIGCETGLHLAKIGKQVTIIEMQTLLAPDASATHRDELMLELDKEENLRFITGARCTSVGKNSVSYEKDGITAERKSDAVVLAAGMVPDTSYVDHLAQVLNNCVPVGDCVRARTVEWAVRDAYCAAINI